MSRVPYPSDVSAEEWALVVPYLTLMNEDAPQREYSLRELFNGVRWSVRTGAAWRMMPPDFPPWSAVDQQGQRWRKAGVFEAIVEDLRAVWRVAQGRKLAPAAVMLDSRTLQSSPASGHRAGSDGAKRKRGSKVHIAVDTLGQLLALCVTAADEQGCVLNFLYPEGRRRESLLREVIKLRTRVTTPEKEDSRWKRREHQGNRRPRGYVQSCKDTWMDKGGTSY